MPAYPVNSTASFLSGVFTQPYMIRNNDTNNVVYLGQDSSLNPQNRELTLPAGAAMMWSGSTELWAVTDAGKTAEVELLFTGSGSFIPGPNKISLVTANNRIYSQQGNLPSGSQDIFDTAALGIDLSAYQSFIISLGSTGGVGSPSVQVTQVSVNQYFQGSLIQSVQYFYLISGSIIIKDNIVGDQIILNVNSPTGGNVGISATLSPRAVDPKCTLAPMPGGGFFVTNFNVLDQFQTSDGVEWAINGTIGAASAQTLIYLPHTTGQNNYRIRQGTISSNLGYINPGTTPSVTSRDLLLANGAIAQTQTTALILAAYPMVAYTVANYNPAANWTFGLTSLRGAL